MADPTTELAKEFLEVNNYLARASCFGMETAPFLILGLGLLIWFPHFFYFTNDGLEPLHCFRSSGRNSARIIGLFIYV